MPLAYGVGHTKHPTNRLVLQRPPPLTEASIDVPVAASMSTISTSTLCSGAAVIHSSPQPAPRVVLSEKIKPCYFLFVFQSCRLTLKQLPLFPLTRHIPRDSTITTTALQPVISWISITSRVWLLIYELVGIFSQKCA